MAGCSYEVEPLYIDSKFFLEEEQIIEAAHQEWVIATDTHGQGADFPLVWNFEVGEFGTNKIQPSGSTHDLDILYRLESTDPGYQALSQAWGDFEGMTNTHHPTRNRVMILVMDRINAAPDSKRMLLGVSMHEFGHWHGITYHLESGLMSTHAEEPCIDTVALNAYCDWRYCGPDAKSTCE